MENVMRFFLVVVIALFLIATVGAWYIENEQEAKTKMVSCKIVERDFCGTVTILEHCGVWNAPFSQATGTCIYYDGSPTEYLQDKTLLLYKRLMPSDFEGFKATELAEYKQEKT